MLLRGAGRADARESNLRSQVCCLRLDPQQRSNDGRGARRPSCAEEVTLTLNPGDLVILRGDLGHAGAAYSVENDQTQAG